MPRAIRLLPLLALLAACAPHLDPLPIPTGMADASPEAALRWADSTRLRDPTDIRFRFRFQDQAGRGRARFSPRDSIRFDVAGPLGMGRASAMIVGDSAIWTQPEEEIEKLVPNYPLFWAMLGVALPPPPGSRIRAYRDARLTVWQFASGQDTVEYVLESGETPRLYAEVRQGDRRIGRVETRLGADGFPTTSRLTVLHPATRLDLNFQQHTKVAPFAPDIWARPAPSEH